MAFRPDHKRILVVDGGGFRGLGCLMAIESITRTASLRAHTPLLPCDVFDLICGTSTGGIIAVLLGRLRLDCSTAIEVYKKISMSFGGDSEEDTWRKLLNDDGFDSSSYEAEIESVVSTYGGAPDLPMLLDEPSSDSHCRTFVPVTSDAPDYSNRTHYVRSYPLRRTLIPSPPSHLWLVREAMRATSASPLYMSPAIIKGKYGFRDPGFSGFNNPIDLACRESQQLWPQERVGLVVSLGTCLSYLVPTAVKSDWCVTDQHATKFTDSVMSKLPTLWEESAKLRKSAIHFVKQLVTVSADTQIAHAEAVTSRGLDSVYYRLDPPLGLDKTDIFDRFHFPLIEETVFKWLNSPEGVKIVEEIVEKAVIQSTTPIAEEQARKIDPPRPSPEQVIGGYNPQLDKKRPETMPDYLKNYHVLFVVDDSGSMEGERWKETHEALIGIAEHALKHNADTVDVRFLNSPVQRRGLRGASLLKLTFEEVQPQGFTPTGAVLEEILNEYLTKLDNVINTSDYKNIRPMDIIVLTDGIPSDKPKVIIAEAVKRRRASKYHPNCIGLQFVQIGTDDGADDALKDLKYGDNGSMVDTVLYTGCLTPERLERILLGGLHPNIRALLPG